VLNPVEHGREDVLLGGDVQLAVRDQLLDLLERQQQELLGPDHLLEVLEGVDVRLEVQLLAAVGVGEAADAEAVGGVQLAQQELAAGLAHLLHLQHAAGGQQDLHVVRGYDDLAGVGVLDEEVDRGGVQVVDGHLGLAVLLHVTWGSGVRARRTERGVRTVEHGEKVRTN
jgi:hypothetical protein